MERITLKPEGYSVALAVMLLQLGMLGLIILPAIRFFHLPPYAILIFLLLLTTILFNAVRFYHIIRQEYELREDGILIKTPRGRRIIPYSTIREVDVSYGRRRVNLLDIGDIILTQEGKKESSVLYGIKHPDRVREMIEGLVGTNEKSSRNL